ncbi:hypothetical protein BYT27DRAFT_7252928 [Phlegmacium glaucopus]|nr:hypothetical protein BYT27DRAFT_7252928 [Phlegmacium glaucopus]
MNDMHPLLFKDRVNEALAEYKQHLAVELKTFKDHIHWLCVAFTTKLFYEQIKLNMMLQADWAFAHLYSITLARMNMEYMNESGVQLASGPMPPSLPPPSSLPLMYLQWGQTASSMQFVLLPEDLVNAALNAGAVLPAPPVQPALALPLPPDTHPSLNALNPAHWRI